MNLLPAWRVSIGMTNASIITIGDELLIGQVIDTNSAWIAQELNKNGIWVKRRVAVGDVAAEIRHALDAESAVSDVILLTGGLGPTADDITKPLLAEYFDSPMVENAEVLKHVTYLFEEVFKRPLTPVNRKQALVPAACTVIPNHRGTAPGMWFESKGKIFVSMPGVPHEMKGMMTATVLPLLMKKSGAPFISHRTLLTVGIGESALAEHISGFEAALPSGVKLAYLPAAAMVRLRLTATGDSEMAVTPVLDSLFVELRSLTAEWMATDEDISLTAAIGKLLQSRGETLATAESCTGGSIAQGITAIAGSSKHYKGGLVPYDNRIKHSVLGVTEETLRTDGAVSESTVRQMVKGTLDVFGSDFALATSGIMGPDGGTPEKPVGTVWLAVGNKVATETRRLDLRFDRSRNIELTGTYVLNLLRKFILAHPPFPAGK